MKSKRRLTIMVLILVFSLFCAGSNVFMVRIPYSLSDFDTQLGTIRVNGTDTLVLADGTFTLNETIIVEDSATLIIENATVVFDTASYTVTESYDNGTVHIEGSVIERGLWHYLRFHDSSNVSISRSEIKEIANDGLANVKVDSSSIGVVNNWGSSHFTLVNSSVGTVSSYESSCTVVYDSTVNGMGALQSSDFMISNSTIGDMTLGFISDSNVTLVFLPTGFVSRWSLYENNTVSNAYVNLTLCNASIDEWWISARDNSVLFLAGIMIGTVYVDEYSTVSITNSTIGYVWALSNSTVYLLDSEISSLEMDTYGYPTVFLTNSTYSVLSWIEWGGGNPKVCVAWYLGLSVMDSRGLSLPNVPVEVYWENGTLLIQTYTNDDGWARLILYEKRIEYLYGERILYYANYTVKARYGYYTSETLIESISDNTKINITFLVILRKWRYPFHLY